MFGRENAKLIVVAALCLAIGAGTPAAMAVIANADKVDGFDAVGYGASVSQRKGKLVATSRTTGRLPNNIIAKAPNAAKFGGFTPAQMRYLVVPISAGHYDPAFASFGNVNIPDTGAGTQGGRSRTDAPPSWSINLRIPPDHPPTAPITFELDYGFETGGCAWLAMTVGAVSTVGGNTVLRNWYVAGNSTTASIPVPAGSAHVFRHVFRLQGTAPAGATVKLTLSRGAEGDTCTGDLILRSAMLRY